MMLSNFQGDINPHGATSDLLRQFEAARAGSAQDWMATRLHKKQESETGAPGQKDRRQGTKTDKSRATNTKQKNVGYFVLLDCRCYPR